MRLFRSVTLPANDVRFYIVGNNGEDDVQRLLIVALKAAAKLPPR